MTVAEAQQKIDSREFTGWLAYDRLDPIGDERGDLHAALVCATLANIHRGRGVKAFEVTDFMPEFDATPKKAMDAEEMRERMFQFAEIHNQAQKK